MSESDVFPGDLCVIIGCMNTATGVVIAGLSTEFYTLKHSHMPMVSQVSPGRHVIVLGSTGFESLDANGSVLVLMGANVGWVYGAELRRT